MTQMWENCRSYCQQGSSVCERLSWYWTHEQQAHGFFEPKTLLMLLIISLTGCRNISKQDIYLALGNTKKCLQDSWHSSDFSRQLAFWRPHQTDEKDLVVSSFTHFWRDDRTAKQIKNTNTHNMSVKLPSFSATTYGEVEDGFGLGLFHVLPVHGDMLYPAALGEQQVRPRLQGVDVRPSGGPDRGGHATVVNAYVQIKTILRRILGEQTYLPVVFPVNTQQGCRLVLINTRSTHTLVCFQAWSETRGSPVRCGRRTSTALCCCGTAWARRHRSRHTWGCTGPQGAGVRVGRTQWRPGGCLCEPHTGFLSSLGMIRTKLPLSLHKEPRTHAPMGRFSFWDF